MRRRRRWSLVGYLLGVVGLAAFLVFVSLFYEITYYLRVNSRAGSLFPAQVHSDERQPDGDSNCENYDIAIVCGGYETAISAVTLVKSLLYFRHNPLTFHFIIDNDSHRVLPTLFTTWNLPAVAVHFYNSTNYTNRVAWIPNRHYSGNFGLLKLVLPDILPATVNKVLVLDTDVLLVDELRSLWAQWRNMSQSRAAFGLVENLSDWYLRNDPLAFTWPALGRGFNTGVMLMNLERLRQFNWTAAWYNEAEEQLRRLERTQLADQDVINAVICKNPSLVYKLPCEFNLQMGYMSQQTLCPAKISDLKIVHWNSPKKTRTRNRYATFFRRHFKKFAEIDGNLFRDANIKCFGFRNKSTELSLVYDYDYNEDGCADLRLARATRYRTLLFAHSKRLAAAAAPEETLTLVTQLSVDRVSVFEKMVSLWPGPVSATIYTSDADLAQLLIYLDTSKVFRDRTNVVVHAVFRELSYYPINYLRNVALNASRTEFVFLLDVDFVVSSGGYESLVAHLKEGLPAKTALVVPAFEFSAESRDDAESLTKETLLPLLALRKVIVFRSDVWPAGHAATRSDLWINANVSYAVNWAPDYEPYVVLRASETPRYDTRFVGFGWNKVTHIMTLHSLGFRFMVLPDVFALHQPHAPSFEITKYRKSDLYRKCMKALKGEFVKDLLS